MKIFLLTFLLGLAVSKCAIAQEITGQWNGILKVQGTQLRIVFNISKTENGYTATMDSPDQNAKGIPVSSVSFDNPKLKIAAANLGLEYEGLLKPEMIIEGTFKQGGMSIPLNLTREVVEK